MARPAFDPTVFPALTGLIERLRELAGDSAHRAGREYLRGSSLKEGTVIGPMVSAVVSGRTEYRVSVAFAADVTPTCTCPAHRRNRFCKHVVAVCLALVERPELFTAVERVLPPPQPKRAPRPRGEESARSRQAAQRRQQQAAGLEMVDRLLAELAGGGLAALGREGSALLASAAETVRALKLRRLGNLMAQLQRLSGDEADPERFAETLTEVWLVRQALAANQDGRATLAPWLTEELLGKTWRDRDLERVSGLDLLPLAETRSDDGEFGVEASHFVDLGGGAMFCERVIMPLALRGGRKPLRRHRLWVDDAGLYPGISPRRIKLFTAQPVPTRQEDVERLVRLADDDIAGLRRRLSERLSEPFAPPDVAVLFRPAALLARGNAVGAIDGERRFLPLEMPEGWRKELPGILPPAPEYALFGFLRLADTGPVLDCLAVAGALAWEHGPVFPDRA